MMLDIDFSELRAGFARYLPFSLRLAAVLGAELIFAVGAWNAGLIEPPARAAVPTPHLSNPASLASVIYTRYAYLVEAPCLVSLVAMILVIVSTHRYRGGGRRQNIGFTGPRRPDDAVGREKPV